MGSCCSDFRPLAGSFFDKERAAGDLRKLRDKGPNPTTRMLTEYILGAGSGETLLDVGGGVGTLSFGLLESGLKQATIIDAAPEYIAAARSEAVRRGYDKRTHILHGDFVSVGSSVKRADIVALDRVVCCYPGYRELLREALRHCGRLFAMSYPRDHWYVRWAVKLENAYRSLRRCAFRVVVHPAEAMRTLVEEEGFERTSSGGTFVWAVELFERKNSMRKEERR